MQRGWYHCSTAFCDFCAQVLISSYELFSYGANNKYCLDILDINVINIYWRYEDTASVCVMYISH